MAKRVQLKNTAPAKRKSLYGLSDTQESKIQFVHSGCSVLDLVMGHGYPCGRVTNLVGDKSTGKTLLAIEAMANFNLQFPGCPIHYLEAESAFDIPYAASLGFPVDAVNIIEDKDTVEDFFDITGELIDRSNKSDPCLLVVDSLDALSDRAEKLRAIDEATMGMGKASKLSQTFRRQVRDLGRTNTMLLVISQVRDNIGVTFGRKTKRSGGRALDFYASIVLYLAEKGKRYKTVKGVKRAVGVDVIAKCDKNKIATPFRQCTFPITFGYGIEDVEACINYLIEVKRTDALTSLGLPAKPTSTNIAKVQDDEDFKAEIREVVKEVWEEVESYFTVKRSKY